MIARINGLIVGLWIFVSAFLWHHTPTQFALTWICGALATLIAVGAMGQPKLRHLNTAVALCLIVGTMVLRLEAGGTFWSNLVSAVALLFIAETPSEAVASPPRQRSA